MTSSTPGSCWLAALVLALLGSVRAQGLAADPDALWLEDVHGERAQAWVAARNAETDARLRADPRFAAERERYLRYGQAAGPEAYAAGGYVHALLRDAAHPLGTWRTQRLDGHATSQWQDALSLDDLARAEGVRWQFRPHWLNPICDAALGSRCLVSLSPDGGDRTVLREFDLATRRFVPAAEGFEIPVAARTVVAWVDHDTVMLTSDFGPGSLSDAGYALQARLWKRGQPLAEARTVFDAPPNTVLFILHAMKSDGPARYFAEVWRRGEPSPEYWQLAPDRPAHPLALPGPVVQYRGVVGTLGDELVALTSRPVSIGTRQVRAGSLLAVPLHGDRPATVIFEPDATQAIDPIFHLAMSRDRLWFAAMTNVDARLYSAAPGRRGWKVTAHAVPPHAAINLLTGESTQGEVMARVESLLLPPTLQVYPERGAPRTVDAAPSVVAERDNVVEQHFATSRDGTRVPYYLLHRRDWHPDGQGAGVVSAYGGFGVSWLPSYVNHEFKTDIGWPIVERGGVFVLANIRGGGEYGPAWHAAARRGLRQNGLDDLAAVAHDLVRRGVVAPGRLGMIGGSNGGLMAAATGIQRPDLFAALIAEVPLTDMLRYTRLYTGAVWINEYGDPDDPAEAARLRAYSPLQNVRPNVRYPEMLLVTSTADDRVHPGHARRLAERLRSAGAPVLFHESTEGGHEGLATVQELAEVRALETVYLLQALKLD